VTATAATLCGGIARSRMGGKNNPKSGFNGLTFNTISYRMVKPPSGRPPPARLRSFTVAPVPGCASVPLPRRAAFAYSSHRGGVGPRGVLSSRRVGEPGPGSFSEPPSNRATAPMADRQRRKAKPTTDEAMLATGRSTLEDRPPAIWLRASRMTTMRPSDQSKSIKTNCRVGANCCACLGGMAMAYL